MINVWLKYRSQTSALLCSGTSAGVEQTGFQSQVSEHGVELLGNLVRAPVLESKFWGQNSGVKT
jgi:hypothetical protein